MMLALALFGLACRQGRQLRTTANYHFSMLGPGLRLRLPRTSWLVGWLVGWLWLVWLVGWLERGGCLKLAAVFNLGRV